MSDYYYSDYESEDDYSDVEYERECIEKSVESGDLIDFTGEVIVNGVRYDADGDVIMV